MVLALKLQLEKSIETICDGNEITWTWYRVGCPLCYGNL